MNRPDAAAGPFISLIRILIRHASRAQLKQVDREYHALAVANGWTKPRPETRQVGNVVVLEAEIQKAIKQGVASALAEILSKIETAGPLNT